MENKHLGVTMGLLLLISGIFPISDIEFLNESSSTSLMALVNPPELNITQVTEIKEFVLPNECSSSYKV